MMGFIGWISLSLMVVVNGDLSAYETKGGEPKMPLHSHCASNPGAWVEVTECSAGMMYYKVTADPGPAPDGVTRRGFDSDVKILLENRSPIGCWQNEGGCTGQKTDLKGGEAASGYDVYVGRGCAPTKANFNVYMDEGEFQAKQISIAVSSKADYYIGVQHREGQSCNFTMSTGALYAAAGSSASCGWVGPVSGTDVNKCQTSSDKLTMCKAGDAGCATRTILESATQGTSAAAIVVPIVLICLVGGVVFGVFYAKKKKKDARMGKFAALSKGGGATGATGGGAASAVAEA